MGYRIIAVVMITFLVTGFGWGKKKEADEAVKTSSTQTSPSSNASATTSATAYSQSSSTRSNVSAEDSEFPTELISTIASGDEETRRARIESLKRLSQALSDMKKDESGAVVANAKTTNSSSANTDASSNTTYPWGNY